MKEGLCKCGCGNVTNKWKQSYTSKNVKKGDYKDFIYGHQSRKKPQYAKCHPDRLVKSKGLCGSCYNKALFDAKPELRKKANKSRRERHTVEIKTRDPIKHAENQRARRLKHRYNLTIKQYDEMLKQQNSVCAICKTKSKNGKHRLYVDHNHTTNKTRGLLCARCNTTVGYIETDINHIKNCKNYIEKYK